MRSKGVKIILTTSLVLAVMFAVKLNNGGSSNDLDTNVSAEVSTASGVTAGVTEVISQNMKQYQSIQGSYEVNTMKPEASKEPEPEITKEPIIHNDDSIIKSRDWDADDSYLLAKIAMAEAEGEDVEGKALVILVVLNRVWTDEFPETIHDVIYQKSQFSPIANGRFDRVEPDDECYEALEMVMSGWDESDGALYFESEKSADNWHSRHLEYLFTHGGHRFYK